MPAHPIPNTQEKHPIKYFIVQSDFGRCVVKTMRGEVFANATEIDDQIVDDYQKLRGYINPELASAHYELIKTHLDSLKFELRLRFKGTVIDNSGIALHNAYVGRDGPVAHAKDANFFESGPAGETVEFLYDWETDDVGTSWLRKFKPQDLEIESSVGEGS